MKERLFWVDAIKGVCIFSVLLNHAGFSQAWFRVDYFFLVGFFFCSGYTFNLTKGLKSRIIRIIDSLIIPYFILSFVTHFLIINNISDFISQPYEELVSLTKNILLGYEAWFIPCLISTEIVYAISLRLKINGIVALGGAFLFLSKCITGMSLPWHIDTAMYSMFFFDIGYRMKAINIKEIMNRIPIVVGILLSALFVLLGDLILPGCPFNTSINEFTNEPLTLLFNVIGIGVLLFVSNIIPPNWYLSYLGQNSLVLFYIHIPFVVYGYKIINHIINLNLPIFDNSLFGVGYIFMVTLFLYPICRLLIKFPVFTGKGRMVEGLLEIRREQ